MNFIQVVAVNVIFLVGSGQAEIQSDEVLTFPGVDGPLSSRMYSGYLPGCVDDQCFYTHYTFSVSQQTPEVDPVVFWQQGSGSSFGLGFLTEVGPFMMDGEALKRNTTLPRASRNPYSWDRISNLLFFEHPPGVGFSYCIDNKGERTVCHWDDLTQARALLAVLETFYEHYSEFAGNDLFVVGESYAGLFVPYLIHELMLRPDSVLANNLKAIAIGNGCTGTVGASREHPGSCNGPYGPMGTPLGTCGATEHEVRFLSTHGAFDTERVKELEQACGFPCRPKQWSDSCVPGGNFSSACYKLLLEAEKSVGDYYKYNFYDTCGRGNRLQKMNHLLGDAGGETYPCGTDEAVAVFCNNDQVRTALNLKPRSFYGRRWNANAWGNDDALLYSKFSGDSYSLYPQLLTRYSVVIYNGDFDLCVPWSQNAEWTSLLAKHQGYQRVTRWAPWPNTYSPSGYVTEYAASRNATLTFLTVKAAGHMVPMYQPQRAFDFFQRFLRGKGFTDEQEFHVLI